MKSRACAVFSALFSIRKAVSLSEKHVTVFRDENRATESTQIRVRVDDPCEIFGDDVRSVGVCLCKGADSDRNDHAQAQQPVNCL